MNALHNTWTRTAQLVYVKDWIIVISSEKGYRLAYSKILFQTLWGINVKSTHDCSSEPVKKKKIYNGNTEVPKLAWFFFQVFP